MKCVICKNGQTSDGLTTVTLTRNGTTAVFKSVPARICGNCGEDYVDEVIAARLLTASEEAALTGI
ncbi:MAG: type II toxin-antitoxin system MqsA family antitoxin [Actinomycetota bacterium]|nr:type II toxin-antitoxin system MqsA family antitoxin [Actinomycetota bacterium]